MYCWLHKCSLCVAKHITVVISTCSCGTIMRWKEIIAEQYIRQTHSSFLQNKMVYGVRVCVCVCVCVCMCAVWYMFIQCGVAKCRCMECLHEHMPFSVSSFSGVPLGLDHLIFFIKRDSPKTGMHATMHVWKYSIWYYVLQTRVCNFPWL